MTRYEEKALGDLIEIKHGFAFAGQYFAEEGPYILLTPGNFEEAGGFRRRDDKQKYYDGPVPQEFILKPGDLLVAMTEQGEGLLGSTAFVPSGKPCLHNQRLGLIRARPGSAVDLNFIYYLFNSRNMRAQIRSSASGTKVRHTSPTRIYSVVAPVPDLPTQRRIASILRAYDDLIEVNRRRIALLEEMARRVFEEWFVRFRFPDHELDDVAGELPKGWKRVPIEQAYEGLYDGPHATPKPSTEGPVFLGIGNITDGGQLDLSSVRHISEAEFPAWTRRVTPRAGDIVFTYEATLNRYAIIPRGFRGCLGRRLALIRTEPSSVYRNFLFLYFFSADWRETITRNMLSGATVERIPLSKFPTFPINLPPQALAAKFDGLVQPAFDQVENLGKSNAILQAQRDLLLPRLISGELSIRAAERELEAVA
jgi:type I restriction enzyme S subunit